jgi:hypothetical protein
MGYPSAVEADVARMSTAFEIPMVRLDLDRCIRY